MLAQPLFLGRFDWSWCNTLEAHVDMSTELWHSVGEIDIYQMPHNLPNYQKYTITRVKGKLRSIGGY